MSQADEKILEFRTIDGSRVAVLAGSIDEVTPLSGGRARIRLRSGSTHDVSDEYDNVVATWKQAFSTRRRQPRGKAGA